MYTEANKEKGQEMLQTSSQEKPENNTELAADECECEYCLVYRKPKLTFVSTRTKGHRWYYQTRSRKADRR